MVYSSLSSPSLLVLISTLALIQAGNTNAQRHQADPVYLIAKITGMILGIENFKEIVEITKNNKLLTDRINEAINLIRENQKI